jgi:hypothetical protein
MATAEEEIVYIQTQLNQVPGWFSQLDAWLFCLFDTIQAEAEVTGDILEVGSYLGRSAILLGFFRRENEELHICDLFEDDPPTPAIAREHDRWYRGLTRTKFDHNFRAFHQRPPLVHAGYSAAILPTLPSNSMRTIHIDGSHSYQEVITDITESKRLLKKDGVLIIDDLCSTHTPGVAAAIWQAIIELGLVPLMTTTKMYATWGKSDAMSQQVLCQKIQGDPRLVILDHHKVWEHDLLEVSVTSIPPKKGSRFLTQLAPPALQSVYLRIRNALSEARSTPRSKIES